MSKKHDYSGSLILAACVLLLLSFGYRSGFGLFVKPITEAKCLEPGIWQCSMALSFSATRSGASSASSLAAGCSTEAAVMIWYGGWALL